jgi:gamma-glutamyl:cysteine ligase YbdK (ATP-grasp superfamily)
MNCKITSNDRHLVSLVSAALSIVALMEVLVVYLCTSQPSKKGEWQSKLDCSLAGSYEAAHLGLAAEMQPHAGIEAG